MRCSAACRVDLGGTRHGRRSHLGRRARHGPVREGRGYPCGERQGRLSGVLTGGGSSACDRNQPRSARFHDSRAFRLQATKEGLRHAGTPLSTYFKATSRRGGAVPHASRVDLRSRSVVLWCCCGSGPEKMSGKEHGAASGLRRAYKCSRRPPWRALKFPGSSGFSRSLHSGIAFPSARKAAFFLPLESPRLPSDFHPARKFVLNAGPFRDDLRLQSEAKPAASWHPERLETIRPLRALTPSDTCQL